MGDWKDISIAHVIIIIKLEVSTFPIVINFFHGYVPEVFLTAESVTYYIYVPGNQAFVFIIIVQFMMSANSRIRVALQIVLVCLYSAPSQFIWRHWTYKMPVKFILSSVWVRLRILFQLSIIQSIIQYVGPCVFSLPTPLVMIEIIYTLCFIIIIKSEVWIITIV